MIGERERVWGTAAHELDDLALLVARATGLELHGRENSYVGHYWSSALGSRPELHVRPNAEDEDEDGVYYHAPDHRHLPVLVTVYGPPDAALDAAVSSITDLASISLDDDDQPAAPEALADAVMPGARGAGPGAPDEDLYGTRACHVAEVVRLLARSLHAIPERIDVDDEGEEQSSGWPGGAGFDPDDEWTLTPSDGVEVHVWCWGTRAQQTVDDRELAGYRALVGVSPTGAADFEPLRSALGAIPGLVPVLRGVSAFGFEVRHPQSPTRCDVWAWTDRTLADGAKVIERALRVHFFQYAGPGEGLLLRWIGMRGQSVQVQSVPPAPDFELPVDRSRHRTFVVLRGEHDWQTVERALRRVRGLDKLGSGVVE